MDARQAIEMLEAKAALAEKSKTGLVHLTMGDVKELIGILKEGVGDRALALILDTMHDQSMKMQAACISSMENCLGLMRFAADIRAQMQGRNEA